MIITDGVHLTSTESEEDLHNFAEWIGLRRSWYRQHKRHPHYDVTTTRKLNKAITYGALKVSSKELLEQSWWAGEIT